MVDVATLAHGLGQWLARTRLIEASPAEAPVADDAAHAVDAVFGEEAVDLLARLGVRALAIDEADNEVTVFVGRKPTRAQAEALPQQIAGIEITYLSELLHPVQPRKLKPSPAPGAATSSRRVTCGVSISLGNDRSAGTLGALVRDRETGQLMGLTCNHVTGGCNNTPVGMPIVSPGILDVTAQTGSLQMIGRHARVLPLRQGQAHVVTGQNSDVALFDISDPHLVSSSQAGDYDTPVQTCRPDAGTTVEKVGRTTGRTVGTWSAAMTTDLLIPYKHKTYLSPNTEVVFQGVCYFADVKIVRGRHGPFADAGDSGALVVTQPDADEPRKAVGILIAEGRSGFGYVLPIDPVLARLGVDLVGGHY